MEKKLKVYLIFDETAKAFGITPPELKGHQIFAFGDDVPATVENLITLIDDEQVLELSDINSEAAPQELMGLQMEIVLRCEVSDEDKLYIDTVNLMMRQHNGQKDKAGKDYYFHPLRVSARVSSSEEKIAALLHDSIEDTYMTPARLSRLGYSQTVIDAVLSVTREQGESYADFIVRAKNNQVGRIVKMADLEDNMDIRRLSDLGENDWHRLNKYLHAYHYLNGTERDTSLIKE